MSTDDLAEPSPDASLVILAADEDAVCVDELCLPPDVPSELVAPAPAPEAST